MHADAQRESLLNAPALMFMGGVFLVVFWVLFPRQPAFRDPSNLSAKDALSVAYLRVLVQSDPGNAPLRLSLVQVLTEAGLTDEAAQAIDPLARRDLPALNYEIRLAELRLALQQLYARPEEKEEKVLRQRIAALIPAAFRLARHEGELRAVVALAEQFAEPEVLAGTFERMAAVPEQGGEQKSAWLVAAARQRMAANQPRLAARDLFRALPLAPAGHDRMQVAKSGLRAYLQAGIDDEALRAARSALETLGGRRDAELLRLAADIAEPLAQDRQALAWLEEADRLSPGDDALVERIARLQVSMGLLRESLARADQLQPSLAAGSERQRLVARIRDWNAEPDAALALWLAFARVRADAEAETRAFELARAKPDPAALVQLFEAVMTRRRLTEAETDAYVAAGLATTQPGHVEGILRRHAERFGHPTEALKALVHVLRLQGKNRDALAVYQEMPAAQVGRQRLELARLHEEAGDIRKSFELLRDFHSPDPAYAEAYWLLLARVAMQLGEDARAEKAYGEALALRPEDADVLEQLQRLALRRHDEAQSERLAHYGWERLRRIEDLQRLMRFSWKRGDWDALGRWLSLADAFPAAALAQAPDYWNFRAMHRMRSGDREAARQALRELSRLRGADPEVTEATIWLLLSDADVDRAALDTLAQPYRNPAMSQSAIGASLVEALAAAEHVLGKAAQGAHWYLRSLSARPRDFMWTLTLADNLEWAGCSASANHVRFLALKMRAAPGFRQPATRHPPRLADYFAGVRDQGAGGAGEPEKRQVLADRWRMARPLENADRFALGRQRERLQLPLWVALADALARGDPKPVEAQWAMISAHLHDQPGGPVPAGVLPLSLDDVDRAGRWFAEDAAPNRITPGEEADVCRRTLAKVSELQAVSVPGTAPSRP